MEAEWSPGNPELAKRWLLVGRVAIGVGIVCTIGAFFAPGESNRRLALALAALLLVALQSWAFSRARRHAPSPILVGAELARYKVRLLVPGSRGGLPCWALFDEAALYLVGRYYTPKNYALTYDDIACAQEVRLTFLRLRVGRVVHLLRYTETQHFLLSRRADAILGELRRHGVVGHEQRVDMSSAAFNLGRVDKLDPALHASCLLRSPGILE